jgi:triacylglycerol lipase
MTAQTLKLSPNEAISAAEGVYNIKKGLTIEKSFEDTSIKNIFDFSENTNTFSAASGIFEFKQSAGFAAMAMGKDKYKNHAILVCRGTDGFKDWLSDFNIGAQISLSGNVVHAGFNRIYNQFREDMLRFVDRNGATTVHCVGHSLGGALANMAADSLLDHGRNAVLYTFGSPRVGTQGFAQKLSMHPRLGVDNIFRLYHSSDPVSMIPFFPFMHAPQPGGEYYVNKTLTINPWDHKMAAYTKSLKNATSWKQLQNPHPSIEAHAEKWLNSEQTWQYCGLNIYNLSMAMGAIRILIKDALTQAWNVAGGTATAGVTILDQLSLAVSKAGKVSKEKEGLVMSVLSRILKMLGIKLKPKQSLTLAFIQFVFRSLSFALNRSVRIALA